MPDERAKFSNAFNDNTGVPALKKAAAFLGGATVNTGSDDPSDPKQKKNQADAIQRRIVAKQTSDEQ